MNKAKVILNSFERGKESGEGHVFKYDIEHNNGKTSVEQILTIASVDGLFNPKWKASIALDDFPTQKTPKDAAEKLADWLERLAAAIRIGEYQNLTTDKYVDIE